MKKLFSLILAALLCLLPVFSASAETLAGGWTVAEDTTVTEDIAACLEAAMADVDGIAVTPVAVLGTQVVAGVNYCILAQAAPIVPDAEVSYVLVYLYHGVDGTDELLQIDEIADDEAEDGETVAGGWVFTQDPAITEEAQTALNTALEGFSGSAIEPVAQIGTQVVAGVNYCFVAKITPVVPDAVSHYGFVTVYAGVDGTCEILEITDFDLGI